MLIPLAVSTLLMLCLLLGSVRVALSSQQQLAMQSRLDLCAVQWAARREQLLERLTALNQVLRQTIWAIYAARGLKAAGPLGALGGGMSESALLQLHQSIAAFQEGALALEFSQEQLAESCIPTRFSREEANCSARPLVRGWLQRERTLFPDLLGPLVQTRASEEVTRVICRGRKNQSTILSVRGDWRLQTKGYRDVYLH